METDPKQIMILRDHLVAEIEKFLTSVEEYGLGALEGWNLIRAAEGLVWERRQQKPQDFKAS